MKSPVMFVKIFFMEANIHTYVIEAESVLGTIRMFSIRCKRSELVGKIKGFLKDDYEDPDHIYDDDVHPISFVAVSAYRKGRRVYHWELSKG